MLTSLNVGFTRVQDGRSTRIDGFQPAERPREFDWSVIIAVVWSEGSYSLWYVAIDLDTRDRFERYIGAEEPPGVSVEYLRPVCRR